jgi:predicted transcriptional regulator
MHFFLKILTIISLFQLNLLACAANWHTMYLQDEYYHFLDPIMLNVPPNSPLYKLSGRYTAHNARFEYFKNVKKKRNIQEWKHYFQGYFTEKEVEILFYGNNSIKNTAKAYKDNRQFPAFSKYIVFLDKQNKLAQNQDKNASYFNIMEEGEKLLKEETDTFLKERYLYLLMRVYHHKTNYHKMFDLYSNYKHILNPSTPVHEWIDALRAGAYQHLHQPVLANQLYAKIFRDNKTNAHYGFYDFKVHNLEEWRQLLHQAHSKKEIALYHFLRAMRGGNEPLFELQKIAYLAPNSVWFERLVYIVAQKLENKRYEIMVHAGKHDKFFKAKVRSYKLQKNHFLNVLNHLKQPTFFTLYTQLYFNLLDYNSLKKENLKKLASLANKKQKMYVQLLNYMYAIHQLNSDDQEEQALLYRELKPLLPQLKKKQQQSILRYTLLQISTLNDTATLEQKLNKLYAQKQTSRKNILKILNFEDATLFEHYINNKQRSFFEKKVFKTSMKNLGRGDISKILATLYLNENDFEDAQFHLRRIPRKNVFSPYNPFNATINGSNRTLSKTTYSQKRFAETMFRLQKKLEKNPHDAREHFLYANGLYNKSWFGNFPMSSVFYHTVQLTKGKPLPLSTNLDFAESEYQLALKYAKKENFKAKISYQLLKIEFNRAISNTHQYKKKMWEMPRFGDQFNGTENVIYLLQHSPSFVSAIEDFKAEYRHTDYGKEVIKRCVTFNYF